MCDCYYCILSISEASSKSIFEWILLSISAFGPILAIAYAYFSFRSMNKINSEKEILKINSDLLRIAMQWPYLEDTLYGSKWDRNSRDPDDIRYNLYCTEVFNLLEELYKLYNGKKDDMINLLDIDEYIINHKKWWYEEVSKTGGYGKDFRNFIDNYILEKEKK